MDLSASAAVDSELRSTAAAEAAPAVHPPGDGDEAVTRSPHAPVFVCVIVPFLQASSAAGSEVRRRRRRAGGGGSRAPAPVAAEEALHVAPSTDTAAGVSAQPDAVAGPPPAVEAAPSVPPAIPSSSAPVSRAGGGVRAPGRPAVANSRVSALVEETDVVGEVLSTSQSGGRFLSGAVESGDSVLKRTVFKEMPLDGALLSEKHPGIAALNFHYVCAGVFKQLSDSEPAHRTAVDSAVVSAQCTPGKYPSHPCDHLPPICNTHRSSSQFRKHFLRARGACVCGFCVCAGHVGRGWARPASYWIWKQHHSNISRHQQHQCPA